MVFTYLVYNTFWALGHHVKLLIKRNTVSVRRALAKHGSTISEDGTKCMEDEEEEDEDEDDVFSFSLLHQM